MMRQVTGDEFPSLASVTLKTRVGCQPNQARLTGEAMPPCGLSVIQLPI